jgi:hypothetical protein
MREPVHFIPIATTIIALVFSYVILQRYRERRTGLPLCGGYVHRVGGYVVRLERTRIPKLVHLWRAPRWSSPGTGHSLPAPQSTHRQQAHVGARSFHSHRRHVRPPHSNRPVVRRAPSTHGSSDGVVVGTSVQPLREHVRLHLPRRRSRPVRIPLQQESRYVPSVHREHPHRRGCAFTRDWRNGHPNGAYRSPLCDGGAPRSSRASSMSQPPSTSLARRVVSAAG